MNIISWIKRNWLPVVLGVVIIALLKNGSSSLNGLRSQNIGRADISMNYAKGTAMPGGIARELAPVTSDQRMVIQDTSLSMLVKDVPESVKGIEKIATDLGGYMVDRSLTKPEGAASGHITLRVPTEKRESALDEIRLLGVRVVSENVFGDDVTDQYVDTATRIASLERVKAQMETILAQAVRVQDLMDVQMQINNIQQQIDSLKGQQKYLEQTAKLTRISVSLSTDELALPYAPDTAWRPAVVFKTAVRSMVGALRSMANIVIWLVVYVPVLLILGLLLGVARFVYRRCFEKRVV